MVKTFYFLVAISLLLFINPACKKSETPCQAKTPAQELSEMTKYATDNGITTTQDASGLLYQIVTAGTGTNPSLSSSVTVKYTGKLLNGTVFDSNQNGVTFKLSDLIQGWQIALPKLKAGGKMKLIVPSSLAYGCSDYFPAVKGKILYFDIELTNVQ